MEKKIFVIYMGYYYLEDVEIYKNSFFLNHANRLEKSIIDDLKKIFHNNLLVLSGSILSKETKKITIKDEFLFEMEFLTKSSLPYLRDFVIMFRIFKRILKLKKDYEIILLTYNNHYHFQIPIFLSNLIGKSSPQINALIDFPNIVTRKKIRFKRFFEDIFSMITYHRHKYYLFLSTPDDFISRLKIQVKHINYQYPLYDLDLKQLSYKKLVDQEIKRIIYIGALEDYYCSNLIIDLARTVSDDMRIEVYGRGKNAEVFRKASLINPKLIFGGFKSMDFIVEQAKDAFAFLLFTCEEIHRYQVPSKLFLYLSFNRPIMTNGIKILDPLLNEYLNPILEFRSDKILDVLVNLGEQSQLYNKYCNDLLQLESLLKSFQNKNSEALLNLLKEAQSR